MQYLKRERGFSLVELLIVITIMAILFGVSVPYYRRYVAETELRNAAQDLYLQLVTAHNKAVNGVVPKDAPESNQRYYWAVNLHQVGSAWEYETKACALQPLPPEVTQTVYDNQFSFSFCDAEDYEYHTFPAQFTIDHEYSGSNLEVSVYFEPITGQVKIFDIDGERLDNPDDPNSNAIDLTLESTDYPELSYTFHINHQGSISQETSN